MKTIIRFPETSNISPNAKIGDGCSIHSHVWIGDEVEIGDECKIQAYVFIPNGLHIGSRVFVGPRVTFTNDKNPSVKPGWKMSHTFIGDDVSIGAAATILPGVRIGHGAMIGAGALVTKDVPAGETWIGVPAKKYEKGL